MSLADLPPGTDLSMIPVGLPPSPDIRPNFVNPQSIAGPCIGVTVLFTVLMFVFVCARIYTKLVVSRSKGWDDYTCVVACLLSIAYMGVIVNVFLRGYAVHSWNFPVSKFSESLLRVLNVSGALYGPTIFFTKLSLLILYYRLFNPSKIMRYLIYLGAGFNFFFYTICLFLYIFLCPNTPTKARSCEQSLKDQGVATSAINVFSDFYILVIPFSAVSRLQLAPKRRLGLLAIFFTGFLACICAIVSLYYRVVLSRSNDTIWNVGPALVTGTVEFNIGIICSCLPTLPTLFRGRGFSRKSKASYMPDSGNSGGIQPHVGTAGAAAGGSKKGFGRLGDDQSRDSIAALEAQRRDGDGGKCGYEMKGVEKDDEGSREWFRQARI